MRVSTDRVLIGAVLAGSLVTLGLQAFVLRPRLWPVPGEGLRHFLRCEGRLDSAYMAPEQLRGEAGDGRADEFSLGVMAYEMLTARLPFAGGSLFDIGMKQLEGAIGNAIAYDRESPSRVCGGICGVNQRRGALPHLAAAFGLFISVRRRSISATAWPICSLRIGCVVVSN